MSSKASLSRGVLHAFRNRYKSFMASVNTMQPTQPFMLESINSQYKIAVAATFTAEPLEESLVFWVEKLAFLADIEFAPYNQVFQQLLDPISLFSQNQAGINILLIRLEDWRRFNQNIESEQDQQFEVQRNSQDLLNILKLALAQSLGTYILCICPASPELQASSEWANLFQDLEDLFYAELSKFANFHLFRSPDFNLYALPSIYDLERDRLGHIPFTSEFFTALGTTIARRIYAIKSTPHKVIVLDCDNTIWKGIVGEDGVSGIQLSPEYQTLQTFMLDQQEAGMLLCLCSKNNEADVMEVFEKRSDMLLKLNNLVSWRINWLPKSGNIKSLAEELNLGLDSFIFLDDNPVECAEVRLSCPEILTLQLPTEEEIPEFLKHVWAFDHLKVTKEDRERTTLYQQNVARSRLEKEAPSIEAFLSSLELTVNIFKPEFAQHSRVAQLTQRTNQFNFTTCRRSEADIQQLTSQGLECRAVEVCDRFGEYGLVGVIIFGTECDAITVDTFLISCRVLGRGVEHQMLRELGQLAQQRNLAFVNVFFVASKKNQPAITFLDQCGAVFKQVTDDGAYFQFPSDYAAQLTYNPIANSSDSLASTIDETQSQSNPILAQETSKSDRFQLIANNLRSPVQIIHYIRTQAKTDRPELGHPIVAPRNVTEETLVALWLDLLNLEKVGVTDNYFDLGGTSLLAVEFFAKIEQKFGQKLPLTTLVERPTIEAFARCLDRTDSSADQPNSINSLVLLQAGNSEPPLFLVHDGDGETLLYRNLAKRLHPSRSAYGIQPLRGSGCPMMHTRIVDMAAYYVQQIRKLQPAGPYLLGGMCAGGVIAFEMACQLQEHGQTVAMVALMDAADIQTPEKVWRTTSQRLNRFTQSIEQSQSLPWHQRLVQVESTVLTKISNLLRYEMYKRFETIRDHFRCNLLRYYLDRNFVIPKFLYDISFRTLYLFAEKDYIPKTIYQGELMLLRATSGDGVDEPYIEKYTDPFLGWEKRTMAKVKVYDVSGGHASMLQNPYVEDLAQTINAYTDQALSAKLIITT